MNAAYAAGTLEVDPKAVNTTVHPVVTTEFATAVGEHSSAFMSHELLKENLAVVLHQ